jgi:coiled-coil domain-containing protein 12
MSDDRKARLAALAARAGRNQSIATTSGNSSQETNNKDEQMMDNDVDAKPAISFRNYVPKDANLDKSLDTSADDSYEENQQAASKRQKTAATTNIQNREEPKSALELALAKTNRESREAAGQNVGEAGGWSKVIPISTKKVNWDLKRGIQHKMDRLERRTQKAIVELLRERLEQEARENGGGGDDSDLD